MTLPVSERMNLYSQSADLESVARSHGFTIAHAIGMELRRQGKEPPSHDLTMIMAKSTAKRLYLNNVPLYAYPGMVIYNFYLGYGYGMTLDHTGER